MAEQTAGNGADGPLETAPSSAPQQLILNAQYIKICRSKTPGHPRAWYSQRRSPKLKSTSTSKLVTSTRRLRGRSYDQCHCARPGRSCIRGRARLWLGRHHSKRDGRDAADARSGRNAADRLPFARAIIANATRDGGFPPLMINPIDFAELLRRQQPCQNFGSAGAGTVLV